MTRWGTLSGPSSIYYGVFRTLGGDNRDWCLGGNCVNISMFEMLCKDEDIQPWLTTVYIF